MQVNEMARLARRLTVLANVLEANQIALHTKAIRDEAKATIREAAASLSPERPDGAGAASGVDIEDVRSQAEMLLLAVMAGDPTSELKVRVNDILSALSASPATTRGEPVAWRVLIPKFGPVFFHDKLDAESQCLQHQCEGAVIAPLYLAPPVPAPAPADGEAVAFPAYGDMPFSELGSAVKAAQFGKPEPYELDPEFYPGHQIVGTINFNSLNRIVTWFVKRALATPPAARSEPAAEMEAWRDVLAERHRQIEAEGWTPAHDDAHDKREMACAAACYALTWTLSPTDSKYVPHKFWPWSLDWWKPSEPRRNLVKAGALILAEIERLDRATLASEAPGAQEETL